MTEETTPTPGQETLEKEILTRLKLLEERIGRIENHLNLFSNEQEAHHPAQNAEEREEALEFQIGQNWFAKAGIVGIAIGMAFLLTFPYGNIPPVVPSLVGYVLAGALAWISHYLRKTYDQISRYLLGGGLLLLYFTTLRLSRFSPEPALTNELAEVALLTLVVLVVLVVAIRRVSPYLMSFGLLLGAVTALLQGDPYVVGMSLALLGAAGSYAFVRFRWTGVLLFSTALVYVAHFVWAMNDPLRGNALRLIVGPEPTLLFPLLYLSILAFGALCGLREREETLAYASTAILNAGGASLLLFVLNVAGTRTHIAAWHGGLSMVGLASAIGFWTLWRSKYSTFVYAMLGYLALSVAIIDLFPRPESLVWLCWESILVLATAVWFRSRFIVVANFFIYVAVFLAYIFTVDKVNPLSLSFGVVALLSARILNWKRERLELKTEMMRNAYLAGALFFIPYALFHFVPQGFISLSWLLTALAYYVFSRLLKSKKYRWMALLTTIMTIVYVFVVDLVQVNPVLRIVSFLVLGTALLLTSMFYTRRRSGGKINNHTA